MWKIHRAVVSRTPPTGDLADNPGMCPDWVRSQADTQSAQPHLPGRNCYSWIVCFSLHSCPIFLYVFWGSVVSACLLTILYLLGGLTLLVIIKCLYLSLVTIFGLKSILSDSSTGAPALFSHPFTFNRFVILNPNRGIFRHGLTTLF